MPTWILLLLAALIGLVTGGAAMQAWHRGARRRGSLADAPAPPVPEAAAEVLSILSSAYVVLDSAGDVLRASPLAYSYGLVRAHRSDYPRLASAKLIELAADVGRNGGFRDERMSLSRSNSGDGEVIMDVRMGALGSHGVLLLADDLTGAERVEETRRDFVANVSHELKTPVGAITLLAETMEDAADDPDAVRRFAARMQTESRRLANLVQEIIELSRVQGTSFVPDASAVDVDTVVREALAAHRTAAIGAGIEVTVGGTSGVQVYGSAARLTTAVSNLVANAIMYSDAGSRIGVSLHREGGMAEIVVKDEGVGIAAEDIDRIFERFYRVDRARSRARGGTGLGLAIVKHIASDHGGEVTVWSRPGHGSTFTLRVPEMGRTAPRPTTHAPRTADAELEDWTT
ncbi:sensor histidine kinase [Brachybacterium huguangmaarense]